MTGIQEAFKSLPVPHRSGEEAARLRFGARILGFRVYGQLFANPKPYILLCLFWFHCRCSYCAFLVDYPANNHGCLPEFRQRYIAFVAYAGRQSFLNLCICGLPLANVDSDYSGNSYMGSFQFGVPFSVPKIHSTAPFLLKGT